MGSCGLADEHRSPCEGKPKGVFAFDFNCGGFYPCDFTLRLFEKFGFKTPCVQRNVNIDARGSMPNLALLFHLRRIGYLKSS